MVFISDASAKNVEKVADEEDLQLRSDVTSKKKSTSPTLYAILPRILLLLCLVMLSTVSVWGWREHVRAEESLEKDKSVELTSSREEKKNGVNSPVDHAMDLLQSTIYKKFLNAHKLLDSIDVASSSLEMKEENSALDNKWNYMSVSDENVPFQCSNMPPIDSDYDPTKEGDDGLFLDPIEWNIPLSAIFDSDLMDACAVRGSLDSVSTAPVKRVILPKTDIKSKAESEEVNA